jgi:hypothetical protein
VPDGLDRSRPIIWMHKLVVVGDQPAVGTYRSRLARLLLHPRFHLIAHDRWTLRIAEEEVPPVRSSFGEKR